MEAIGKAPDSSEIVDRLLSVSDGEQWIADTGFFKGFPDSADFSITVAPAFMMG